MTDKDTQATFLPLSAGSAETLWVETPPLGPVDKGRALRQRLGQIITRIIAAPSSEEAAVTPLEEARQALHELEVYQVQLEIQNEELHRRQVGSSSFCVDLIFRGIKPTQNDRNNNKTACWFKIATNITQRPILQEAAICALEEQRDRLRR